MENRWERISVSQAESERLYGKARTFAGDVWFRFRHKPTALIGFILAVLMIVFAVVGPFLTPYDYSEQETSLRMAMLENTTRAVYLFDSGKFGREGPYTTAQLRQMAFAVSDLPQPDSLVGMCRYLQV